MGPKLPNAPGTYVLVMGNRKRITLEIGRLGRVEFPRGWYLYTGSAFGPGGLAARAGRHLKQTKSLRWHIDYLTTRLQVRRVWLTTVAEKLECRWADLLFHMGGRAVISGFGSSDCTCAAHLFRFHSRPSLVRFRRAAGVPVRVLKTA